MGTAETNIIAFVCVFVLFLAALWILIYERLNRGRTALPAPAAAEPLKLEPANPENLLAKLLVGQDVLISRIDTLIKLQKRNLQAVMGTDALGLDVIEEKDAELREQAEIYVNQYHLPWDEALQRARSVAAYRRAV